MTPAIPQTEWDKLYARCRELEALLHKARHERDMAERRVVQMGYALDAAHEELRRLKYGDAHEEEPCF